MHRRGFSQQTNTDPNSQTTNLLKAKQQLQEHLQNQQEMQRRLEALHKLCCQLSAEKTSLESKNKVLSSGFATLMNVNNGLNRVCDELTQKNNHLLSVVEQYERQRCERNLGPSQRHFPCDNLQATGSQIPIASQAHLRSDLGVTGNRKSLPANTNN